MSPSSTPCIQCTMFPPPGTSLLPLCSILLAGDFEFLCRLQVSLLEPSAAASSASITPGGPNKPAAGSTSSAFASGSTAHGPDLGSGAHHMEHAMRPSGASKLASLLGRHKEDENSGAPPLTSRYIRVINTYDVSLGLLAGEVWMALNARARICVSCVCR